ncbi:hypothetical protein I552_8673 [Mycobacterium xenopi 3993]|nr:hypothetical protein I552_8673 [Mycobacterium xenopi 3993]
MSTTAAVGRPQQDPPAGVPGVETTLPAHIPPDALECFPPPSVVGRPTTATVADPAAPKSPSACRTAGRRPPVTVMWRWC